MASETLLLNVLKLKHNLFHQTAVANICSVGEWVQTLQDAALQQVGTGVQILQDAALQQIGTGVQTLQDAALPFLDVLCGPPARPSS